jgi:hypothetical protein
MTNANISCSGLDSTLFTESSIGENTEEPHQKVSGKLLARLLLFFVKLRNDEGEDLVVAGELAALIEEVAVLAVVEALAVVVRQEEALVAGVVVHQEEALVAGVVVHQEEALVAAVEVALDTDEGHRVLRIQGLVVLVSTVQANSVPCYNITHTVRI